MHEGLLKKVLHREKSLFTRDIDAKHHELIDKISRTGVLVIGAAGTIGSAFVQELVYYRPKLLHLVDTSENNLVELVRDLRSSDIIVPDCFKTFAIGLGTIEFEAFLKQHASNYDYCVNFSALKHVRSERDPYTLMRMVYTNTYSVNHLLITLKKHPIKKFFSISSDKAVNPVSIMGATKCFMEKVMIQHSETVPCSSSRFANVAFSDGSLLFGFKKRIEKLQPLSAPSDVKRYFISSKEAGQLCLLSCFIGNNRDNYFPKLNKELDMHTFSEIAEIFLASEGKSAIILPSEE